jgi:hypothetical protein
VDGEANADGSPGCVEVMTEVGLASETPNGQGARFEGRIPADPPIVASKDTGFQVKFVGDDDAEAAAVGDLTGEVESTPTGVSRQMKMNHGPAAACDVKASYRHMASRPEIDVDDGVVVSFQVQTHGCAVEVGQRVSGNVFDVGKGGFWPIDDDGEEVRRCNTEGGFNRRIHRMKDHANGGGLRFLWTHP